MREDVNLLAQEDRQGLNPFTLPGPDSLQGNPYMGSFKEPVYVPPQIDQDALDKALEAIKVRKEANDAATNATDQYEADVADFKNTEATEIEQGIASLPEILQLSEEPFSPAGIGGIPQPRVDPVIPRMPNEKSVPFNPDSLFSDPYMGSMDERDFRDSIGEPMAPEPVSTGDFNPYERVTGEINPVYTPPPSFDEPPAFREEPVFTPPPAPPVAAPEPVNSIPAYDFINEPEPVFNIPDFDFLTGGLPPVNLPVAPPVAPVMPPPPVAPPSFDFTPDFGEGDFFDTIGNGFNDNDFGGYVPPSIPSDPVIPPTIPGNPYEGIFDGLPINFPPINFPPGLGDPGEGDFDDTIGIGDGFIGIPGYPNFPYPPYLPPEDPPYVPPPPPPPEDQGPTGPVNYYTGQPLKNPYQPYATDSGAAPLNRQMTPQQFGQAPGFGPNKPPDSGVIIKPPRMPPPRRDDRIYVPPIDDDLRFIAMNEPTGAKNGKYLNKGISQLPMNGQGDTLTTQVFQAGFRPRR